MHTFLVTITQSGGMSEKQLLACEEWLSGLDVKSVVAREEHKSGLMHLHAVIEDVNSRANGFRRKLVRALGEICDFTPVKALDVKLVKVGDEERSAGYAAKDGMISHVKGWSIKSLLASRAEELKERVYKKPQSTFMLNEKNAEEIIIEFANRKSMSLGSKNDFIDVMAAMCADGYSVSRIKPCIVYAQVMGRTGSPEYMKDWWAMKLGAQM